MLIGKVRQCWSWSPSLELHTRAGGHQACHIGVAGCVTWGSCHQEVKQALLVSWGWHGSPRHLLLACLWGVGHWGFPGDRLMPRAGALSLSWRPELAELCLPQLAFGPDRLYGEDSWSGGAHAVCVCAPCECAMSENPGPLCGKSCLQLLLGLPEFLSFWHLPGSCVFCGYGWWSWFCCPLSSHLCPWGSVLNSRASRGWGASVEVFTVSGLCPAMGAILDLWI